MKHLKKCFSGVIVVLFMFLTTKIVLSKTDRKQLAFIHIPKNAGTTIEKLGLKYNVKWGRYMLEHDTTVTQNKTKNVFYNWHIPPRYLKAADPYEGFDTFCVIRDPLSRILSEYKWFYNYDTKKDNSRDLNIWLDIVLTRENVYSIGGVDRIGLNDGHLFPQYFFIYDEAGKKTCNHVLNIDTLTVDFNRLMKAYNYNFRMTQYDIENNDTSNFKISVKDINESNLKRIYDLYYMDFYIYRNHKIKNI